MKKFINKVKGFTLTELAIVIAVIAILIAVLVPTFISLINSANESRDTQMIYNVNNALSIENASNAIETPAKALDVAEKAGYKIENLTPTSDSEIYYDQENVRFIIVYSDGTRYPSSAEDTDLNSPTVWRFVDEATYQSILAQDTSTATGQSTKTAAKTAVKAEGAASAPVTHTVSYIAKGEWTTSFDYTGMGGVDTTRATGITEVNYTIQVVENTTYSINPIYSVSDEVQKVAVVSAVEGEISVKKSCGQNTYTTAAAAEGVTCSLTFEAAADDSSPVLYDTSESSTITVIVTQNGEDVTEDVTDSIKLAGSADFSTGVLELGTVKYPYLIASEDDYDKINNGGYCKVTANIIASKALTITNATSTLDLNGYTITSSSGYSVTVSNSSEITVMDSSEQKTGSIYNAKTYAFNVVAGGTLILNSGKVEAFKGAYVKGCITVNDGSITSSNGYGVYVQSGSATISGGTINATGGNAVHIVSSSTIGISGGSITSSSNYGLYVNGKATIIGGSITSSSSYGIYMNGGEVNIYGGSITGTRGIHFYGGTLTIGEEGGDNSGISITGSDYGISTGTTTEVTVYGGKITGTAGPGIQGKVVIHDGKVTGATSGIDSGISSKTVTINGGTVIGGEKGINSSATVKVSGGTVYGATYGIYASNTVTIEGGTIGKYENDISQYGIYYNDSSSTMTIENGKIYATYIGIWTRSPSSNSAINSGTEITVEGDSSGTVHGIYLTSYSRNEANLTINGGTIVATNSSGTSAGISVWGPGYKSTQKYTTLTVNGGNIYGETYGITGNGSQSSNDYRYTKINISGGTIGSDGTETNISKTGIYNPQVGEITVTSGTVKGINSAIEMRSGTLTISGGTFTSTAKTSKATANGSGTTIVGAAIAISQHTTNNAITVTISGGEFKGYYGLYEIDTVDTENPSEDVTISISGSATFTSTNENGAGYYSYTEANYESSSIITDTRS